MLIMLNKDFVKWVLISFVIAAPVAWYIMNKWLEGFAYKTEMSWWIFALAGFLALTIALAYSELAELEGSNEKSGGGVEV